MASTPGPKFDSRATHTQRRRDRFSRQATQAQSVQFLVARPSLGLPFRPSSCLFCVVGCRRRFFLPNALPGCDEPRSPTDGAAVAIDRSLHGITKMAQQVPAICNLSGIGSTLSGAFGKGASAIPGDDLHTSVVLQPVCDRLAGAVGRFRHGDDSDAVKRR